MKHHDQKANWRGKGSLGLHFHITVYHRRKSGQGFKAGTRRQEPRQEPWRVLLTGKLLMACLTYSHSTQDHLWVSTVGWTLPHPFFNQENVSHRLLYRPIGWRSCFDGCSLFSHNSSIRINVIFSLALMSLGNVKNISLKLGRGLVPWIEALGTQAWGPKFAFSRSSARRCITWVSVNPLEFTVSDHFPEKMRGRNNKILRS